MTSSVPWRRGWTATWCTRPQPRKPDCERQAMHSPERQEPDLTTQMRTEIGEQPAALRATLDALLPRADEVAAVADGTRQVLFIARGTSDNAAVYGSYLLQVYAGRLATLGSPSV